MQTARAGWYPDPKNPAQQRYWDGTAWTRHVLDADVRDPADPIPMSEGKQAIISLAIMFSLMAIGSLLGELLGESIGVLVNMGGILGMIFFIMQIDDERSAYEARQRRIREQQESQA